jgi:hypothetical protein
MNVNIIVDKYQTIQAVARGDPHAARPDRKFNIPIKFARD